jgi:hypothetical protein
MRTGLLVLALAWVLSCCACGQTNAGTKAPGTSVLESGVAKSSASPNTSTAVVNESATNFAEASAKVDFPTQIKPILEARCQPCHFSGGKVYTKMPFDRPETVKTLGTKLFTRIKDESERRLIRDFLTQE